MITSAVGRPTAAASAGRRRLLTGLVLGRGRGGHRCQVALSAILPAWNEEAVRGASEDEARHWRRQWRSSQRSKIGSPFASPPPPSSLFPLQCRSLSTAATMEDGGDNALTTMTPFLLADIGEGIAEVELMKWYVSPGDHVSQFDKVCEVQSDKATVDITSRYDGVVTELCGKEGEIVKVGTPLMLIEVAGGGGGADGSGSDGEEAAPPVMTLNNVDDEADALRIPAVAASYPDHPSGPVGGDMKPPITPPAHDRPVTWDSVTNAPEWGTSTVSTGGGKVSASPAVRKLGRDNGIDLTKVAGSGPGGRVTKADVLKMIGTAMRTQTPAQPQAQIQSRKRQPSAEGASPPESHPPTLSSASAEPLVPPGEDVTVPIRGYHRLMVKTMTASLQIPHMVYSDEIDLSDLITTRRRLMPLAVQMGVEKLSYLPFFVKAASLAMVEYPVINSTADFEDNTITYHGNHDIGVAMDTPRGLAVPVVRGVQDLSVLEVAREIGCLQALASDGALSESDVSRPTFTISNIGSIGGTYTSPVVTPPQVAICAIGKIRRLPRFVSHDSTEVREAHVAAVSWGGDHRVVDGATMARFANRWKMLVEDVATMALVSR